MVFSIQFATLATTTACLFGLINGDEVFATIHAVSRNYPVIYTFSICYFYSFIILFIFGVANLFIAIIDSTYQRIKEVGDRETKSVFPHESKK